MAKWFEVRSNQISTDASSVRTFCLFKSDNSVPFASLHWYCSPEWSVLTDKTGCQTATDPDKCPMVHWKMCTPPLTIKCPKNDMLLTATFLCMQTFHCTVNSSITAAWNTVMFIGLFCNWVCLMLQSSALWLDSTSVWTAKWCKSIFLFIILMCWIAAHQCT